MAAALLSPPSPHAARVVQPGPKRRLDSVQPYDVCCTCLSDSKPLVTCDACPHSYHPACTELIEVEPGYSLCAVCHTWLAREPPLACAGDGAILLTRHYYGTEAGVPEPDERPSFLTKVPSHYRDHWPRTPALKVWDASRAPAPETLRIYLQKAEEVWPETLAPLAPPAPPCAETLARVREREERMRRELSAQHAGSGDEPGSEAAKRKRKVRDEPASPANRKGPRTAGPAAPSDPPGPREEGGTGGVGGWKKKMYTSGFHQDFALSVLHGQGYNCAAALQLLGRSCFRAHWPDACGPPARPYMNKWHPKDARLPTGVAPYLKPTQRRAAVTLSRVSGRERTPIVRLNYDRDTVTGMSGS